MTFCGTIGRYDGKFLTLALHCLVLYNPLLDLEDTRNDKKPWRKRNPGAVQTDENGQLQMFPLTMKQRKEYLDFAKNLRYFLKENLEKPNRKPFDFIEETIGLEFSGYEFYGFFEYFKDEEMKPAIEMLEKLSNGESLDDYMPLINFLSKMNGHALWKHESYRGGCF